MSAYTYECPMCDTEIEFEFTPFRPGVTWDAPDRCYPDEGGLVRGPGECPNCEHKLDHGTVYEKACDYFADRNFDN